MSANLLRPDAAASNKFQQIAATAVAAAQTGETNSGTRYDLTNVRQGTNLFKHPSRPPNPALELVTQASTESALDSKEITVQTDWSTIGKVRGGWYSVVKTCPGRLREFHNSMPRQPRHVSRNLPSIDMCFSAQFPGVAGEPQEPDDLPP